MCPIEVKVLEHTWITSEDHIEPGKMRVRLLGGEESLRVRRSESDTDEEGDECYHVEIVSSKHAHQIDPDLDVPTRAVMVGDSEKSAHFYVGDTKVSAKYIEKK